MGAGADHQSRRAMAVRTTLAGGIGRGAGQLARPWSQR
jgi:hypothetical protein